MEKELYEYIMSKVQDLEKYSINYPKEKILEGYHSILENPCSLDEKKQIIDDFFDKIIRDHKRKEQQKDLKEEYTNFDKIKEVIDIIIHSPLAPYVTIYGGTVPYLITGIKPKREFRDIDMFASVEDMPKIREIIKNNPDIFHVILDSKDYTDDYGIELKINGLDITIFTHEYTQEGIIVRNFIENMITNSIEIQAILFYGIFDEETTIETNINGSKIKLECPEYVYIQKDIAQREKDKEDIAILKGIINAEKLEYIKRTSDVPKVLMAETIRLEEPLSKINKGYK